MTKTPLLLAVIAIVVGVVLLRFSLINGSEINHVPAHLPFPGSGFTAGEVFHLPTPGWFSLEVITPARDTDKALLHREQPPVLCNVSLEISGPDGFLRRVDISRFANSGWTRNWDICGAWRAGPADSFRGDRTRGLVFYRRRGGLWMSSLCHRLRTFCNAPATLTRSSLILIIFMQIGPGVLLYRQRVLVMIGTLRSLS